MSNQEFIPASEFCDLVTDGTHDSPKKTEFGVKLVTSKNIVGGKLDLTSAYFISESDAQNINKRSQVHINDILLSMIGTVGEVALIEKEPDFVIKNVGLLKNSDPKKAKWLYYYLKSPITQNLIKDRLRGTTQQYIPLGELRNLPILKPNSEEHLQNTIDQLSSLDKKIQLNTQINQTLEQIAQALFKSWFVDFDPVRAKVQALSDGLSLEQAELAAMQAISGKTPEELTALSQTQPDRYAELAETAKAFPCEMVEVDGVEVPKGWEVKPLGDLISFVKGKKPKAVSPNQEENMLPHILTSSLEGKYNEFCESNKLVTVEYHNTIMLMDGSNSGRVAIGHNGVIGSTLAKINLENNKLWAIIYQFLKHKEADIQANTTGTTIPHTDKNRVNNYLMTIPNDFLLDKFTELFDNSLLKIISNRNQIISLETIRDLLLPRLLNGEIE